MKRISTNCLLLLAGLLFCSTSLLNAQTSGTSDAILQGFYWNTNPGDFSSDEGVWWDTIAHVAPDLANGGIITVWTPPANKGFAGTFDMGYGIYDYYDFGSFFQKGTLRTRHGNATQFQNTIDVLHQNGLKVMGDLVLNHRAGAEETQPEECDHQGDNMLENRFTKFRPASGRAPMNAEDFHPTDTHCDLFGPYHDRVFFEDLCYFEDIDQVLNPAASNDGWYHGPHNLGRAGDSLIVWGRYLLDEVGFDELRLDAVKHIEPGFMAPFLVEMAQGDQPFAVGELFDGDIGTLKGYRDQVEAFNTTFGAGSKDANLAIFDFNLRFAIRDFCNNTSGGYDMWNLNNAGLLFNGMPGEDIVNFVENHDFDRIGYVTADCNDPDVIAQVGSTCLKFSIDSGHDPVVSDKHIGYAYITAAEGRPSIFWKDWFWFGLKDEIKWQLAMRSEMASGSTTPITFLNPFFNQGNGGDLFIMNRNGNSGQGGLVLTLNDSPDTEGIAFVNTPFSNVELKDYSDAYLFTQTTAFGDSRAQVRALPRNYAFYAPTGRYPTPPDAAPSAFTLGNHEGAKLHFLALRADDASSLLVNGAPIEPGDQVAVRPAGGGDAVGLGRVGQSFEWDGVHDMIIEVLGGANTGEAKGGLLNGDGFELVVFDKSTGTTEVVATLNFAASSTGFNFSPLRPFSKGGAFSLSTSHSEATYQVGAISLITGFDTRPVSCVASDAAAIAYGDGWQNGDNDGSGFGAWTLNATSGNAGHFTAGSTGNGDGDSNIDGDIDTGGRSWGLFANSGATSEAIRSFTQPLAVGETFSIRMDNGFVDGTVGFALRNSDGQNLLEFIFTSGSLNYALLDASGSVDSGIGYTDEGLDISITLPDPTTYELMVTRLEDGSSNTLSGSLLNPTVGSQEVTRLRLFNFNAGFNAPANLYFNSLEICGEPACPVASVSVGTQTVCDPADNTYDQEITVNFNSNPANGQLSVNGTTVPLNISGGTQTVTLTDLVSDGQDVDVTVVLTGSEACTVSESALFTAPADCQDPTISCPGNATVNTEPGLCSAQVVYNTPVGADNLPGANTTQTEGLGSGAAFPLGSTTEAYTVTDAAGNMAMCSFTITVEDNEPPTLTCPDNIIINSDADACGAVVDFTDPVAVDNCILATPETLTFNYTGGVQTYVVPAGVTSIDVEVYGAKGADGNGGTAPGQGGAGASATGTLSVTPGETLYLYVGGTDGFNGGGAAGVHVGTGAQTFAGNGGDASDIRQGGQALSNRVVVAAGGGGGGAANAGSCDNGDPSNGGVGGAAVGANGEDGTGCGIGGNGGFGATLIAGGNGGTAGSNCSGSGDSGNAGVSGAAGMGGDGSNNGCSENFQGGPGGGGGGGFYGGGGGGAGAGGGGGNGSGGGGGGGSSFIGGLSGGSAMAGVNNGNGYIVLNLSSSSVTQTSGLPSGSEFPVGTTVNAFEVTDGAGNTATCSFEVTVNDAAAPQANCPTVAPVGNDPSQCGAVVHFTIPSSTDNCPGVSQSATHASGDFFPVGTTTVTVTATDAAGNQDQCTFDVVVNDTEAPSIACNSFDLNLDGSSASIPPAQVDGGSTDNCGVTSLSLDNEVFDCNTLGAQTVTLTAVDAAGNSSTCQATVNVIDNNAPTALCANPTVNLTSDGTTTVAAAFFDGGSSAVCGGLDFSASQTDFGCGDVGNTLSVTLTVISLSSGLTATCTASVTVADPNSFCCAPPSAVCDNITVQLDASGQASITPADIGSSSTAECGLASDMLDISNFDCSDLDDNVVVYTITDVNGDSDNCQATVIVEDNIAPAAVCKTSTIDIEPNGSYTLQESDVFDSANSSDNCGIVGVSFPPTTFGCGDVGMTFDIIVTATDASGESGNCTAMVTVAAGSGLPAGWTANDIGNNAYGNDYSFDPCNNDGEFIITGSGYNGITTTTDEVAFASQELCGDFVLTAKIEDVDPNGFGGLMVRETTAPGSRQYSIFSNLGNILMSESRTFTNGTKSRQSFYRPNPFWLRMERMGPWLLAYYSATGTSFQYIHAVYLPLPSCLEVGLAAFAHSGGPATTVFSNVEIDNGGNNLIVNGDLPSVAIQNQQLELRTFPNPASEELFVTSALPLPASGTAIVRNKLGQIVERRALAAGVQRIEWSVADWPSGLYVIEVRLVDGYRQALKVVRQQ